MQLWTDYEGVTIDGSFLLKKLLMPEGRSAFYTTSGPTGEPTVLRLIECHFDEEEILARWRCVDALNHPNFLKFERFGQTELDGHRVVYAVLEKVDANLAEVLDQGHLTVEDAAQLTSSLVAALDELHTHGFVHEHIEPRNIFALGSVVKLRSDCIREAPEGEEGRVAKQRDVHDLAVVLLRALTQQASVEGIPAFALPAPFGQIIRNGLDGTWGLANMKAALERQFGAKQPAAPKPENAALPTAAVAAQKAADAAAKESVRPEAQLPLPLANEDRNTEAARATVHEDAWGRKDTWDEAQSFPLRSRWLGTGIAAALLLLCTWALAHAWNTHRHKAAQAAAISQPAAPSTQQTAASPAPKPVIADLPASAASHAGWRVITYTYNHRAEAEKKVSTLANSHPELQPEVFSPSGNAPYLVSIGGVLDRDGAYALARRSRSLGLPHDTFAQNYKH
jgi:eukaryotic-like serine/threonine-protein kinase